MQEMPVASRMPVCSEKGLVFSFSLYAALSLVSMAAMGIGAFILCIAILWAIFRANLKVTRGTDDLNPPKLNPFKTEWTHLPYRRYFALSCILSLTGILSLIGALISPLGYGNRWVKVHFLKDILKIGYFFWPCLLVLGLRKLKPNQKQTVLNTWIASFGILSVIGIFQYFIGWPRPQPIPDDPGGHFHATLFLGHHLSVASIFIFPFFVTLDQTYHSFQKTNYSLKTVALFLTSLVGFTTLTLTYSRTLWVALPLGIMLWIFLRLPKSSRKLKIQICVGFLLAIFGLTFYPPIQSRLHQLIGFTPRQELWLANLEFLKQRPFTGVGWRHNQELSGFYLMNKHNTNDVFSGHAHNNLLDVLGGQGTLGALAWIAWCAGVFWILLRNRKSENPQISFSEGLICAWFVFQLNGLTQVNFWEAKVEHQLAWVIAWSLL